MEEQKDVPVFKGAVIYGVIVGLASVVIGLILYFIDMSLESWSGIFNTIVLVLLVLGSLVMFRKEYGKGYASYGRLVLVSIIIGIVASLFSAAYNYTMYSVDEGYLQDTKYYAVEQMDKRMEKQDVKFQERFSDEQYEMASERMDQARKKAIQRIENQTPAKIALGNIFGMVFMSVIVGLIGAIFIRKQPKPQEL